MPAEVHATRIAMRVAAFRRYAPMVAACFLLAWVVALGWWLLLPSTRTVELVLPPGTAAQVAAGERPAVVPDRLVLRRGDTLAIRNEDTVPHRLGSTAVPPAQTVRVAVTPALFAVSGLLCSFHPGGSVGVEPLARPGIERTVIPTLLAGVPLSIALVFSVAVASRLGTDAKDEVAV
jgi:hypothetical protein